MLDQIVEFAKSQPILAAFYASLFTWGLTALGASLVFFFKRAKRAVMDAMLGFTGGVMVAASFWSLLAPAIDNSEGEGFVKVIPAAVGFLLGALVLLGMDKLLPHLHINFKRSEAEGVKTNWHSTTLLVLAITLHNIPEGLAVGVLFGAAANLTGPDQVAMIVSAVSLAIGIGIQNFPEGFAVSMPLRRQGGIQISKFLVRPVIRHRRTCSCGAGSSSCEYIHSYSSICVSLCSRGHDLRSGGRSDT